ncbi:hypothetical protein HDV00_011700 [Rhizophlyctis rosea]|nr:hypothetical protein HDV00_011700 [Rhizophlyctis rosea]
MALEGGAGFRKGEAYAASYTFGPSEPENDEFRSLMREWARMGFATAALKVAVSRNHEEVVKRLLEAGADANDGDGELVFSATRNDNAAIVKLLLREGKLNKMANSPALTASTGYAAVYGFEEVLDLLLETGVDIPPGMRREFLWGAAYKGHAGVLKVLLAAGVGEDDKVDALWGACMSGHPDAARVLLAAGAEKSLFKGLVFLLLAVYRQHRKIIFAVSVLVVGCSLYVCLERVGLMRSQ